MRSQTLRILSLALFPALFSVLFLTATAPPAGAQCPFGACPQNLDDFQEGPFPPAPGGFDFTQLGLEPEHVLSGTRHTMIDATVSHSAGMFPLGGGDIGFQLVTQEAGTSPNAFEPDLLLEYPFDAPFDLTYGGHNDRIVIDVLEVDQVAVLAYFQSQGSGAGTSLLLQPGANVIYLSKVSPYVDVNAMDKIGFYFNEHAPDDVSLLRMSRIRLTGPSILDLLLDLPLLVQQLPPFIDPGPLMKTYYLDAGTGESVPTLGMTLRVETASILDASGGEIGTFPMLMDTGDNGLDDLPGSVAGYQFVERAAGKTSYAGGRFELRFRTDTIGDFGVGISEVSGVSPQPFTPQDIFVQDVVQLLDPSGRLAGHQSMRVRVRVPDESPYRIRTAGVEPITNDEFALIFDIASAGSGKAEGDALFSITFEGEYAPSSVSTPAPLPRDGAFGLSAFPSVTSGRTVLRFSRPVDRRAELRIFDVAGRLVRSLSVDPGRSQLSWDTRDAQGRPVASGVYLLRVREGRAQARGKVTVVR